MLKLNGREVSQVIRGQLKVRAQEFKQRQGRAVGLAVVLVGEDTASQVYVKNKVQACEALGLTSFHHHLSGTVTQNDLEALIKKLNRDKSVDGILVQFPLPEHLCQESVLQVLNPFKDADGLTTENLGLLYTGKMRIAPCTPKGIIALLKHYGLEISGKKAVVLGRSRLVGLPVANLLLSENATVTICHSRTKDISSYTREADIIVVAVGKPRFLGKEDFKQGAVVVDVGIHRVDNQIDGKKLCGDVRFDELDGWVKAASPVPGGVGPMTITMLLQNTIELAEKIH